MATTSTAARLRVHGQMREEVETGAGRASATATGRYVHVGDSGRRQAVDAPWKRMETASGPTPEIGGLWGEGAPKGAQTDHWELPWQHPSTTRPCHLLTLPQRKSATPPASERV